MSQTASQVRATGLEAAWNRFFFAEGSPLALALFRILFALALGWEIWVTWQRNEMAIEGGFHLGYVDFVPLLSESTYGWVHVAQYPLVLLVGLGFGMRFACVALLVLQGWVFFADVTNFRNHPYLFLMLLGLLALSPADRALSIRALLERGEGAVRRAWPLTIERLIQLEICLVYFLAAVHKMHGFYLDGGVLDVYMRQALESWSSWLLPVLGADGLAAVRGQFQHMSTFVPLAWATVVLEAVLPFALWVRRLQPFVMPIGIAFHIGIAVVMSIYAFSLVMIGCYLLFLGGDRLKEMLPFAKHALSSPAARGNRMQNRG